MKKIIMFFILTIIGFALGYFANDFINNNTVNSGTVNSKQEPLYWVAPMDANYRRDKPGKSPMGMDLMPMYEDGVSDDKSTVTISSTVENNLGVRIASVIKTPLLLQINTIGYVQFDENKLTHIHPRVEGWIETLFANSIGEPIKEGKPLFALYSPDLVNAQEEFVIALRSNNRQLINASRERLRLMGVDDQQIKDLSDSRNVERLIQFMAPHDGYVSVLNVRQGMFIKPTTEVMAIGDLSSIWVIADVLERQAGWLALKQSVIMTVESFPGEQWSGEVDYIYPVLDSTSRTVQVRIRFDNPNKRLKPNMLANLQIQSSDNKLRLLVPRAAVIRGGQVDRVVKSLGNHQYKAVVVKTGQSSDDWIEIMAGLSMNDQVIVSGQFLIDSESNIDAEMLRMSDQARTEATVWTTGTIQRVMIKHNKLAIKHASIVEWDWPEMTMDFTVADEVDIAELTVGMNVSFCIEKLIDGRYQIFHIEPLAADSVQKKVNEQNANPVLNDAHAHHSGDIK